MTTTNPTHLWPMVPLPELCSFQSGGTPSTKNASYWQGPIPWITSADITENGEISFEKFISNEAIASSAAKVVPPGTLLLVTRIGVGKTAITTRETSFSQDVTALRDIDPRIDQNFLRLYLSASGYFFAARARGVTIRGISRSALRDLKVPLPPLDEQRRIAGILDEVSNEMRLTRKLVANLTDAIASFQADIFTVKDESRTLGELCEINPKLTSRPGLEEAIPFVPMDSVGTNGVLHAHEQRLFKDVKSGYTHFKQDDILVAKITPCFENMKSCTASIDAPVGAGSTEFHVLRAKADADARYLHWYMRQSSIYRVGAHFMRGSSGHRRIPAFYLDNLRLPVHGIDEQKAIADRFDSIQALIEKYQARLSLLNELQHSLSTRAFQGEL